MDFRIEQRIRGPVDAVARAYTEPEMYATLTGLEKIAAPELVDVERDGDVVRLRLRYRFIGHLPGAAQAVLDPKKLTWVEESNHDLDDHTVTWRLVPDHYGDRFRASGDSRLRADGDVTVRRTEGSLVVKTPFVGRLVERALVSGLQEHLEAEAPLVEVWLAARGS